MNDGLRRLPKNLRRRADAERQAQPPRCACGRPVPTSSLDSVNCAEHDDSKDSA